jgi:anti-sigma factor RsiW
MTHDEVRSLLDAYIDDELDLASGLMVEAHLQHCPECTAWLAERRSLLGQLHADTLRYPLPPQLTARIRTQLRSRAPGIGLQPQWYAALAAGLIVAIGAFLLGRAWQPLPDLRAELVNASVRAVLSSHPIDVLSSDHHTVKPWLSTQLPFSPPVPELSEQGDTLLGARVDYLDSTRVAALLYQHGHHQINVYVWPRGAMSAVPPVNATVDGFHLMTVQAEAFTAVMVSDMSAGELAAFCERWRASAAATAGPGH